MLTNRLEFTLEVDGETQDADPRRADELRLLAAPELRAAAYQELYRVYGARGQRSSARSTSTGCATGTTSRWGCAATPRRSPCATSTTTSPTARSRCCSTSARENAPLFQRYFRLKAGWLGMDRLRRYDLYAPLAASDREIPYAEAVRSVLETFDDFHPQLRRAGRAGLRRGPHRQRDPQGQARRRLLLDGPAALHALGAGQLRRPGARRGDPRPRARPRHPQHAGRAATRSSPSTPRCRSPRPPRSSARC